MPEERATQQRQSRPTGSRTLQRVARWLRNKRITPQDYRQKRLSCTGLQGVVKQAIDRQQTILHYNMNENRILNEFQNSNKLQILKFRNLNKFQNLNEIFKSKHF
jgi:hypothetical protein